jgi:sugar/nucleoside kinase (ribokinase family)
MTIIGDVRIEFRMALSDVEFSRLHEDHLAYTAIDPLVSGTAVNLARRAGEYFARVNLIGKIGEDGFNSMIADAVRAAGAEPALAIAAGMGNGFTVVLRDRGGKPDGVRLLVAGRPAPGELLSPADIRDRGHLIAASDVVVCDGYALLSAVSAAAMREVASQVAATRALLCLDVVPHDIDGRVEHRLVHDWLRRADIVIVEGRTLGRLFGFPTSGSCTAREVSELLGRLPAPAEGRQLWLVRCGPDGMSETLVYRAGEICRSYQTGYAEATETMGFGDRLAAAELFWWLARRSA